MNLKRRPLTLFAILVAAFCLLLLGTHGALLRLSPGCAFRHMTGWNCGGCGGTRCAAKMVQGDFAGAIAMNPFLFFSFWVGLIWLAWGVWREWHGRRGPVLPAWLGWSYLALFLVFSVTRNFPWWPFTLLAPH